MPRELFQRDLQRTLCSAQSHLTPQSSKLGFGLRRADGAREGLFPVRGPSCE